MSPVNCNADDDKNSNKRNTVEFFSQNEKKKDACDGDRKSDPIELFECLFDYF